MTEKNKYKLQKKLEKVKQLIIIGLMVLCGLWYVTKGREKDNSAYAFSEQKSSKIIIEKEGYGVDSENEDSGKNRGKESTEFSSADEEFSNVESLEGLIDADSDEKVQNNKESDGSDDIETLASADNDSGDRINLNSATQKELESLPGVGPATAKNIIDYREKYGGFADIEEIKNVKRIGDKTYEKLKEYITV
ncbi:ComEA family DNA-binding protein [Oribacterium sp. FC2011]|uniref:ComEA family DNA-binding protein n=1 Tax=Oribacterium sp. FC2011 TaxID=1408311 RepID=UPI000679C207|nr:helix-hairpin-helix domain-containing protein [Oribacterium sp. FC2011]